MRATGIDAPSLAGLQSAAAIVTFGPTRARVAVTVCSRAPAAAAASPTHTAMTAVTRAMTILSDASERGERSCRPTRS
jgi:hypothetical protein